MVDLNSIIQMHNNDYLDLYDNRKPLYIIGNADIQFSKMGVIGNKFEVKSVTRDNWDELFEIRDSVVYNCTPLDITDWVHKSNDFIDCRVTTQTRSICDITDFQNNLDYTQAWSFRYDHFVGINE